MIIIAGLINAPDFWTLLSKPQFVYSEYCRFPINKQPRIIDSEERKKISLVYRLAFPRISLRDKS